MIKLRRIGWAGHVARMGHKRGICRVLVEKPDGKRSRRTWEDDIKMDPQEVGCGGMNCIKMSQDRNRWSALVNVVKKFRVPKNVKNF